MAKFLDFGRFSEMTEEKIEEVHVWMCKELKHRLTVCQLL